MSEPDIYLLGRSEPEELRLKRQIADLAPLSDAHLAEVGIKAGERVVDLGCGPGGVLHLLGKRVGPTGSVLGIERSPHLGGCVAYQGRYQRRCSEPTVSSNDRSNTVRRRLVIE